MSAPGRPKGEFRSAQHEGSQVTSTVVFRQAGNNLRLGNTLVWVAPAHEWCRRHGFEFHFPAARRVLGGLLRADSALLQTPAGFAPAAQATAADQPADDLALVDAVLTRMLTAAAELGPRLGSDNGVVSLVPLALGCVAHGRGIDWDEASLVEFVRAHRVCIVNEPLPFRQRQPVPPDVLGALLAPAPAVSSMIEALAAAPGLAFGLHVRQTDYKRWSGGKFYRDNDFYNALLARTLSALPARCSVLVAHDGEFVADQNVAADARVRVSAGAESDVVADFVRLAMCDVVLGPQSTFTTQAHKLGHQWHPKQRDMVRLLPESSVDDLIHAIQSRLR